MLTRPSLSSAWSCRTPRHSNAEQNLVERALQVFKRRFVLRLVLHQRIERRADQACPRRQADRMDSRGHLEKPMGQTQLPLQIARLGFPKTVRQHPTEVPVREPSSDVEPLAVPPIAVVQQRLERISPGELRRVIFIVHW